LETVEVKHVVVQTLFELKYVMALNNPTTRVGETGGHEAHASLEQLEKLETCKKTSSWPSESKFVCRGNVGYINAAAVRGAQQESWCWQSDAGAQSSNPGGHYAMGLQAGNEMQGGCCFGATGCGRDERIRDRCGSRRGDTRDTTSHSPGTEGGNACRTEGGNVCVAAAETQICV
jgi:hypothetical protein